MPTGPLLVLLALVLAAPFAAAQTTHRDSVEENKRRDRAAYDSGRYAAILDAYLAGDRARSVAILTDPEWDEERLRVLFRRVNGLADPDAPWSPQRFGAAALLHTDVALALTLDETVLTPHALVHIDAAANLIGLGLRDRGNAFRPFAQRLYLSLSENLRARNQLFVAERILRTARDRLRDNPAILYESGTLAEQFATDYAAVTGVSNWRPSDRDWRFPFEQIAKERTGQLRSAEAWLREAAALDPSDDRLRLHLGRVLALRERDDEALRVLGEVMDQPRDHAIAYLAGIFIAGLRMRQGKVDEAVVAYRGAIARFPLGHAAYVGLSEALQRSGRGDESRVVLQSLLSESMGPTREPLWWYHVDPQEAVDERLDALRQEVRR